MQFYVRALVLLACALFLSGTLIVELATEAYAPATFLYLTNWSVLNHAVYSAVQLGTYLTRRTGVGTSPMAVWRAVTLSFVLATTVGYWVSNPDASTTPIEYFLSIAKHGGNALVAVLDALGVLMPHDTWRRIRVGLPSMVAMIVAHSSVVVVYTIVSCVYVASGNAFVYAPALASVTGESAPRVWDAFIVSFILLPIALLIGTMFLIAIERFAVGTRVVWRALRRQRMRP